MTRAPTDRPASPRACAPARAGACLLATLAVALPFVFPFTEAPNSNFWPLLASAACAWLIALLACSGALARRHLAPCLAAGLLAAALAGGAIGLAQYFLGDAGLSPWVRSAEVGHAMGNLRQRNQQATLVSLGLWALLWWLARLQPWALAHPQRRLAPLLAAAAAPWALALLAGAGAATASRTGALQWLLVIPALLLVWRRSAGALAPAVSAAGLGLYLLACWGLPLLLTQWTGVQAEGLFTRLAQGAHQACTSRVALWGNVLELIAARPWAGWGWGALKYAHYITPFEGLRFCVLLDNAHNLPLQLAVELGLPAALALVGGALWAAWRARPWRERDPARQLAWGVLALIALHSLLEFPLWYGPFQLAAALAVALLLAPLPGAWRRRLRAASAPALLLAPVLALALAHDYRRVAALYQTPAERAPALRDLDAQQVARQAWFFGTPALFAWLTTTPVEAANAAAIHAAAQQLLHYSPEPRVIEKLIASARLLGREDEAALHTERYRRAWPQEWARFAAP
ncbi:polymerase [Pulveribacter suum]|uniref:Polymerase n=2 Tax=Pulveribacter suum TaxID=2116657 RepID=A0A2P1NPI9_9BURK|nr:polymerase [Pulveribacter suum]